MKARLQAVASSQKIALTMFGNTVEAGLTDTLDDGLDEAPTVFDGGGDSGSALSLGTVGQPQSALAAPSIPDATFLIPQAALPSESPFARMANAVARMQRVRAALEERAAATVEAVAVQCGAPSKP